MTFILVLKPLLVFDNVEFAILMRMKVTNLSGFVSTSYQLGRLKYQTMSKRSKSPRVAKCQFWRKYAHRVYESFSNDCMPILYLGYINLIPFIIFGIFYFIQRNFEFEWQYDHANEFRYMYRNIWPNPWGGFSVPESGFLINIYKVTIYQSIVIISISIIIDNSVLFIKFKVRVYSIGSNICEQRHSWLWS